MSRLEHIFYEMPGFYGKFTTKEYLCGGNYDREVMRHKITTNIAKSLRL